MSVQLETFTPLFGNLTGLTKMAAKKIINRDLVEALNKILNNSGAENINSALKSLIEMAALKATNGIGRKIAAVFTVIASIFAIIVTIVTFAANGNIIIPIAIFAVIIAIIWVAVSQISKTAARKISEQIFKAIEDKIPR